MSRALVIANQYSNFPENSLHGCFNDASNFINVLRKIDPKMSIVIMRDDYNKTHPLFPTRNNILRELNNLTNAKENKLYFYYSGHGCSVTDYNRDELSLVFSANGSTIINTESLLKDSCIVTNDQQYMNIIVDDEISQIFSKLSSNKRLYGFLDCCNSGTGFDLCYVKLGRFTTNFTSSTMQQLKTEINSKCSIISSNYPTNKIKANVMLFSGTRDKDYAYESVINGIPAGFFTTRLCWLLNYGVENMSVKEFYYYLIALINNQLQVPVLTCSQNLNIDLVKMNDFKLSSKLTNLITTVTKIPSLREMIFVEPTPISSSRQLLIYYLKKRKY